jgi:hypothetical protein
VNTSELDVAGGYGYSSTGQFVTAPVTSNIHTGASTTADPLSALQPPDPMTLTPRTYTGSS